MVGFADFDKARRGGWIGGVEVRMVAFAEGVELGFYFGGCGSGGDAEGFVVVWDAGAAGSCGGEGAGWG